MVIKLNFQMRKQSFRSLSHASTVTKLLADSRASSGNLPLMPIFFVPAPFRQDSLTRGLAGDQGDEITSRGEQRMRTLRGGDCRGLWAV